MDERTPRELPAPATPAKDDSGEPEVFAISRDRAGWQFSRRALPGAVTVAAAAAALEGCAAKQRLRYRAQNEHGVWETKTVPCGTPLPSGAVCVCNCVSSGGRGGGTTSHTTCTCVPVHYWHPT